MRDVLTEISQLDVSQDVEAALLDVVDEGDEAHAAAGVGHHQQDLGPPELDVVLPHVQHQQILAHLRRKCGKRTLDFFRVGDYKTERWGGG